MSSQGHLPQVTTRDRAVLREVARLTVAPPAALAHLFPTPGAAYVRLGILAKRGLIARTHSFGRRAYAITVHGADVVDLRAKATAPVPAARIARLATVTAALAPLGYRPTSPPRPGFSRSIVWFASRDRVIAVYVSPAHLTSHRVRRLLERLQIIRHRAHAVILAGNDQTVARRLPPSRYPATLVVPVPLLPDARALIASVV